MFEVVGRISVRKTPRFGLSRTLAFYLAREVVLYSLLGFIALTAVLVSQNLGRRLDDLVGVGFTWADLRIAVRGMAVMFMSYAAPLSFLIGALLALRRLASDSEILAMRACGVGLAALAIPVLTIGALVSASTGYLLLHSEHLARQELRSLLTTVAARGTILRPGSFRTVGGRVIFIRDRDRQNNLRGIMISAEGGEERPYVIFAEHGSFEFDSERKMVRILLSSGDLHIEPDLGNPASYERISFERLDYEIDIQSLIESGRKPTRPKQMTLAELRDVRARAREGKPLWGLDDWNPINYELEIHRRFALPFAPLIFAVLAVALGASRPHRTRSWALLLGIVLAFSYYALIAFGSLLAEKAWLLPALAPWGPTALFAILAVVLLQRTRTGMTP